MTAARGFEYDRLMEADDQHVDDVRDRLYAAPCGMGVWVSVKDGTIIHGNGGNEREQWAWQKIGPWIKLDAREVEWSEFGRVRQERDAAHQKLDALRATLAILADPERQRTGLVLKMAEQYTPTTEDVREAYAGYAWLGPGRSDVTPEFDRWLAAHDTQVLRDAPITPTVANAVMGVFFDEMDKRSWSTDVGAISDAQIATLEHFRQLAEADRDRGRDQP